jgi:hypothetical protein
VVRELNDVGAHIVQEILVVYSVSKCEVGQCKKIKKKRLKTLKAWIQNTKSIQGVSPKRKITSKECTWECEMTSKQ